MGKVPFDYNTAMRYTSAREPNTVHARGNGTQRFFHKYFIQKAMGVFEFTLPKHWDRNYFLYTLFETNGFLAVINTDKFGVIPQACGLEGYNVMYAPTHATIANPCLKGILRPRIDVQCSIIKLQDNYSPITDIVDFYADKLALCYESLDMNIVNTKFAYIFGAGSKSISESLKAMYDDVMAGNPAVFADKKLFNDSGQLDVTLFNNNLKQNFIGAELFELINNIQSQFETEIGLNNANTDKRERLISDEVNANNQTIKSKAELWLECLQFGMEKARSLFGLSKQELNVELRFKEVQNFDNHNTKPNGTSSPNPAR